MASLNPDLLPLSKWAHHHQRTISLATLFEHAQCPLINLNPVTGVTQSHADKFAHP